MFEMCPLRLVFLPGKNFRSSAAKNFFRFTVEFGGPWGPLPLPSRGPRAPYFYPEGAHGAPYGCVSSRKKIFAALLRKFFSASRSSSGAHGAPYFYPVGDPGPPTFTQKGPMGPPTVGFPTKKKFRRACAPEFFLSKSVFLQKKTSKFLRFEISGSR